MTSKKTHKGKIEVSITCNDPEDSGYSSGVYIDLKFLEKYDLKPGDHVLYEVQNLDANQYQVNFIKKLD